MGYEAQVLCDTGAQRETVKALLESDVLILRGSVTRHRIETSLIQQPRLQGEMLTFEAQGQTFSLYLGAKDAEKWLHKLQTPPPTLAAKLGIGPDRNAAVFGEANDLALQLALDGATTANACAATVLIAIVLSPDELLGAVAAHAGMPCRGLWVVFEKGKKAALGDTAIRHALRERGYKDNKTTAVSDRLTATRYMRP